MNCCCKPPCITANDVSLSGSQTVISLSPFEGALPPSGCFVLNVPPVFPCNDTNPVVISSGSNTYQIMDRCGNVLRTDQLARHCCRFPLHLRRPNDTLTTLQGKLLICLDKLCPSRYIPTTPTQDETPAESSVVSAVTAKSSGKSAA